MCLYDRLNKKPYFYDLSFPNEKIIIEYNGHMWHPNKNKLTELEWNEWRSIYGNFTADEIYNKDRIKIQFAESLGYEIFEIWSNENLDIQIKK